MTIFWSFRWSENLPTCLTQRFVFLITLSLFYCSLFSLRQRDGLLFYHTSKILILSHKQAEHDCCYFCPTSNEINSSNDSTKGSSQFVWIKMVQNFLAPWESYRQIICSCVCITLVYLFLIFYAMSLTVGEFTFQRSKRRKSVGERVVGGVWARMRPYCLVLRL